MISLQDKDIDLWELYTRTQFEHDIHDYQLQIEGVLMETLQAFDAGDVDKARIIALPQVNGGLTMLSGLATKARPEPWQREEQAALAKNVLNYMYAHRDEIDLRWGLHVAGLKPMLTDPEDLGRLAELEDRFAEAEKKMRQSNGEK